MTTRELVRRWYGQIKEQPEAVKNDVKNFIAHTTIPSTNNPTFGNGNNFAPFNGCIDLVLYSHLDDQENVQAVYLKGFRASYDSTTNQMKIGGEDNFLFIRDLMMRPNKEGRGRIINTENEHAILLAGLEMESEREVTMRYPPMAKGPRFAEPVLAFDRDNTPKLEITDGLIQLVFDYLEPGSDPLYALCAPKNYNGTVRRVVNDNALGMTLIELTEDSNFDPKDLVVEFPSWGQAYVKQGQPVRPNEELASIRLPSNIMRPIRSANKTLDDMWYAMEDYLGEQDAQKVLNIVWESETHRWAGMTLHPSFLLSQPQAVKANSVWRNMGPVLNRICHNHRVPAQVVRTSPREARISVWAVDTPMNKENYQFEELFGNVDLVSMSEYVKTRLNIKV